MIAVTSALTFGMFGCANAQQGTATETTAQAAEFKNINAEEFAKIKQQDSAIVIDVRTPGEVASGYITGATVFADINGSDFEAQMSKLDKNKTYIVYCRSGARSSSASDYMVKNGFTNVYNLSGGISNWSGEVTKP